MRRREFLGVLGSAAAMPLAARAQTKRARIGWLRFAKYNGDHIKLERIALTRPQVRALPSFPAADKRKDPRYRWFVKFYGDRCWELDAMDPRDLRECVEREITRLIEPVAWARCETVNRAEQASLKSILEKWGGE